MQKILIVAATKGEIPFLNEITAAEFSENVSFVLNNTEFTTLITGVGMVATTYALTELLSSEEFDLVVNVGVAGSFNKGIKLAEVVIVNEEFFGDMGVEDDEKFLSLFDIKLADKNVKPFIDGAIQFILDYKYNSLKNLKRVKAISVNKVHGNEASIAKTKQYFDADIESMEGAACFYVCKMMETPCIEIRTISNYVEKRNRAAWKLEEAINNLGKKAIELINEISKK